MSKRDDDLPSSSSQEFLTHADHGKAAHQEKQAREKGQLSQLKRDMLMQDVTAAKDAAAIQARDADDVKVQPATLDPREDDADDAKVWDTKEAMQNPDDVQDAADAGKATQGTDKLRQLRQKIVKDQTKPERAAGSND